MEENIQSGEAGGVIVYEVPSAQSSVSSVPHDIRPGTYIVTLPHLMYSRDNTLVDISERRISGNSKKMNLSDFAQLLIPYAQRHWTQEMWLFLKRSVANLNYNDKVKGIGGYDQLTTFERLRFDLRCASQAIIIFDYKKLGLPNCQCDQGFYHPHGLYVRRMKGIWQLSFDRKNVRSIFFLANHFFYS